MTRRASATGRRRDGAARAALNRLMLSSLTRDTSLVALSQALFKGSLYVGSILLSRSLSVEQFAVFGYFLVTAAFLGMFFSAGLTIAATKAFAEAAADPAERGKPAAVLVILLGSVVAALALSPFYLPWVTDDSVRLGGIWLVAAGIAQAAYLVAAAAMYGASAFRYLLTPLLVGAGVLALGMLLTALERDLLPVLLGICLAHLVPAILYAARLRRIGLLRAIRPSPAAARSVAATAAPTLALVIITSGVVWLVTRSLLDHAVTTAEFNMFVIGMQWFVLVLFVPNALGNALFPRFIHGAREGRFDIRLVAAVSLAVFAIVLGIAVLGALLTPALTALYGLHYDFSRGFVFAILAAAAIAGTVTMLGYPLIAALGVGRWLWANLVLLAACGGILVLRPPTDAFEAALVLCASYGPLLLVALLMLFAVPRARLREAG